MTRHSGAGELQDSGGFVHLALAAYEDETAGVYLFYCDEEWTVLNDTCHGNRAEAERQAQFEFEGVQFRDLE